MKKIIFLIGSLLVFSVIDVEGQKQMTPTHMMEVSIDGKDISQVQSVTFFTKDKTDFVSIEFDDGYKSTPVLKPTPNEYKFQLSEIKNNQMVNIYYVGSGNEDGIIVGQFNVSVDGVPTEALSGSFTIRKIYSQSSVVGQSTVGGHFGVVQGLFTLKNGDFSNFLSPDANYSIGFPMGITVKNNSLFAFDIEMVPSITFVRNGEEDHEKINILIHPGLLMGIGHNMTLGARLAYEVGEYGRYGFTPLLNFGNDFSNSFVEIVLPIRMSSDESATVTIGIHVGIGF